MPDVSAGPRTGGSSRAERRPRAIPGPPRDGRRSRTSARSGHEVGRSGKSEYRAPTRPGTCSARDGKAIRPAGCANAMAGGRQHRERDRPGAPLRCAGSEPGEPAANAPSRGEWRKAFKIFSRRRSAIWRSDLKRPWPARSSSRTRPAAVSTWGCDAFAERETGPVAVPSPERTPLPARERTRPERILAAAPEAEARGQARELRSPAERHEEAPVINLNARRRDAADPLEDEMARLLGELTSDTSRR